MSRYTKPPPGTLIDWRHPFARGLQLCALLNEGDGIRVNDISPQRNHGVIASASWGYGSNGLVISFDGVDDVVLFPKPAVTSYPFTMVIIGLHELDTFSCEVTMADDSVENQSVIFAVADTNVLRGQMYNTTFELCDGATSIAEGERFHGVYVGLSSTDRRVYLNGKHDGRDTDSISFPTGLDNTALGSLQRSTPIFVKGKLEMVAIYDRVLSAEEVAWHNEQPYGMLRI